MRGRYGIQVAFEICAGGVRQPVVTGTLLHMRKGTGMHVTGLRILLGKGFGMGKRSPQSIELVSCQRGLNQVLLLSTN